jgi:hypothetical protein
MPVLVALDERPSDLITNGEILSAALVLPALHPYGNPHGDQYLRSSLLRTVGRASMGVMPQVGEILIVTVDSQVPRRSAEWTTLLRCSSGSLC